MALASAGAVDIGCNAFPRQPVKIATRQTSPMKKRTALYGLNMLIERKLALRSPGLANRSATEEVI